MSGFYSIALLLGQVAAEGEAATQGASRLPAVLGGMAVIVGSFLLGHFLARWLRMPDYGFKIGIVFCTLAAGIVVNVLGWPPRLGIDLSGGVVLVYEIDRESTGASTLEQTIEHIRTTMGEVKDLVVRPIGKDVLEVSMPAGAAPKSLDEAVGQLAEGGIKLTKVSDKPEGERRVIVYRLPADSHAVNMADLVAAVRKRINPAGVKEVNVRKYGDEQIEVIIPEVEQSEVDVIKEKISTSGLLEFRILANQNDHKRQIELAFSEENAGARDIRDESGVVIAEWVADGRPDPSGQDAVRDVEGGREVLIIRDDYNVTGQYLTRAAVGQDELGNPCVEFGFDSRGARLFAELTHENLPDTTIEFYRLLGIVLDKRVLSAPRIITTISDRGQITGQFDQAQVDVLVGVLNAGKLPATLNKIPISEQRISAQLGEDTIRKGKNAMIISTIAVLLFMLVYYRFAGLVADLAVIMNLIIAVALMIMINAAFTLPGLAGLVLTVGMAVDANVLIYERMREETARGASLRMAIRNGFSRAMSTIIDSNLTTLITAAVLYTIGTDQIKGFAVTLILGLLVSMYTAIFVGRVIFDIAERKRWITQLHMMKIVGQTNIDFVRWRTPAIALSVVVIAIGMAAAFQRQKDLFDIDFTGGTSVQVAFRKEQPQPIEKVRVVLEKSGLPDVAVSSVGDEQLEYKVDTSEKKLSVVKDVLVKTFGKSLRTYSLNYSDMKPIVVATADPGVIKPAEKGSQAKPDAGKSPDGRKTTIPAEKPPADEGPATGRRPADERDTNAKPPAGKSEPADDTPRGAETDAPADDEPDAGRAGDADKPPAAEGKTDEKRSDDQGAARRAADQQLVLGNQTSALATLVLAQAEESSETQPGGREDSPARPADAAAQPEPGAAAPAGRERGAAPARAEADDASRPPSGRTVSSPIGTRVTLNFSEPIAHDALKDDIESAIAAKKLPSARFELKNPNYRIGSGNAFKDWTLEIRLADKQTAELLDHMKSTLAATPVFPSASEIGGRVADETKRLAGVAILASLVMIVLYVWIRFQNLIFGLAAVLALIHDVAVTIGFLALSSYLAGPLGFLMVEPFKISLAVVAALLTIVGYSINDTIVIFDRIREIRGKSPELNEEMINLSLNQTLSRTILTSGTVLIGTLILYIFGGLGIHPFAYAMLIGLVSGTYSTVYMAAPVLLWLKRPTAQQTRQPAGAKATAAR